jgi:1,4-alpha-glucan branching enzyme
MLGARFENNGARFRVWAPNADKAFVAYDGHWDQATAFELTRNGEYFDGFMAGAGIGLRYKLIFIENGQPVWRLDPAARDTTHSGLLDPDNGGFIINPAFHWPPFHTPRFEDLIIYQLHVGTFAGMNDHFASRVHNGSANISFLESKLGYIQDLGFNAVQLLPIQEFHHDRSWGYNPSFYYSVESAYGTPDEVRQFVAKAHERGLAVLFDVVYNHVGNQDNPLWNWEIFNGTADHGEYLYPPHNTDWGPGPAFQKQPVRDFFVENALMLFEEYQIDGLRFDATRAIEGNHGADNNGWKFLRELTWRIKEKFPDKYLIAEHLEDHDTIVRDAGMSATWFAAAHHEFQRAAQGEDPINKLKAFLGKDFGYGHNYPDQWNLVKYCVGSHDDCGDDKNGDTLNKPGDWERHRYFVEFYGGRDNWHARAKARLGWALNIAAMGTPLMFMGLECHHWGYWHDTADQNGDHRFNWAIAGDARGMEMRRLVAAANTVRWASPSLRGETLDLVHEDPTNNILAFKRYVPGGNNCVLVVVNIGDNNFANHSYGVKTGNQFGQWTQILCTQDAAFGGWDGAGNAFHEPWTREDGMIYINVPQWSVVMLRLL